MFMTCVKRKKRGKKMMDSGNSRNNFDLVLAPFQPTTRVVLEVSLNKEKSTTSILNVKNPSDHDITVHVTKRPIPEKCVDLSFTETTIASKKSSTLYIHWSPKLCVTWWDILQLVDNNRNKYEVTLIMRSKDPPEKYLKTRIQKTLQNGSKIPKKLLTFKKEYQPPATNDIQPQKKRPRATDTNFELSPKNELETSFREKAKIKRPRKESNISTRSRLLFRSNRDSTRKKSSFFERVFRRESSKEENSPEGTTNRAKLGEKIYELRRETFLADDSIRRYSFDRDLRRETFIIAPKSNENIETDINCNVTISPEKMGTNFEIGRFSSFAGIVSSTPKSTFRSRSRVEDSKKNFRLGYNFGDRNSGGDESRGKSDDKNPFESDLEDKNSGSAESDDKNRVGSDLEDKNSDSVKLDDKTNVGSDLDDEKPVGDDFQEKLTDENGVGSDLEDRQSDSDELNVKNPFESDLEDKNRVGSDLEDKKSNSAELDDKTYVESDFEDKNSDSGKLVDKNRFVDDLEAKTRNSAKLDDKNDVGSDLEDKNSDSDELDDKNHFGSDSEDKNRDCGKLDNKTHVRSDLEDKTSGSDNSDEEICVGDYLEDPNSDSDNLDYELWFSDDSEDKNSVGDYLEDRNRCSVDLEDRSNVGVDFEDRNSVGDDFGDRNNVGDDLEDRNSFSDNLGDENSANLDEKNSVGDNFSDKDSGNDSFYGNEEDAAEDTDDDPDKGSEISSQNGKICKNKVSNNDSDERNENRSDNTKDNDSDSNSNDDSHNYFGNSLSVTVIRNPHDPETAKLFETEISLSSAVDIHQLLSDKAISTSPRLCDLPKASVNLFPDSPLEDHFGSSESSLEVTPEVPQREIPKNTDSRLPESSLPKTLPKKPNENPLEESSKSPEVPNSLTQIDRVLDVQGKLSSSPVQRVKKAKNSTSPKNHSSVMTKNDSSSKNEVIAKNETFGDPVGESFPSFSSSDENWLTQQESEFKKWLNALMTPPEDFTETSAVDIGKIWQSVRTMDVDVLAESRESVSARYHTNTRLDTLRKAAAKMYQNPDLEANIASAMKCIQSGRLMIKRDTNLHLDIGLQKEIISLFMNYNPLWLRIGLETVYGLRIPLKSNNDLVGITRFLLSRFFSNSTISDQSMFATSLRSDTLRDGINTFILETFLKFVAFLDYAKTNKLIGDDPCLFRKKSPNKESRMILVRFSTLVLGGIGDVIKLLRIGGYVVKHQQSYLEEFDYAVQDMNYDLRDGVRLCRVMEIVTGQKNLTPKCSVPAISKVQRIYNLKIALDALEKAGYVIIGDIEPKQIADGNREKTLNLLWQIVYKFYAPRYLSAAILLQNWWRKKLRFLRFRKLLAIKKNSENKNQMAVRIQTWWREKKKIGEKEQKIFVWKFLKTREVMMRHREQFERVNKAFDLVEQRWMSRCEASATLIQRTWRRYQSKKQDLLQKAAIFVQRRWRNKIANRKTILQERLESIVKIQRHWRRILELKRNRRINAARIIENYYLSWKLAKREREHYLKQKQSAKLIQKHFRCWKVAKEQRANYQRVKKSVTIIQQRWRAKKMMNLQREKYLEKKMATILIQRKWRAILVGRAERENLTNLHKSAMKIQRFWREVLQRRKRREERENLKRKISSSEFSAKTLADRLRESIDIFKMTSDLGRLSMCLASLDLITRLSNRSCIIVCNVGLVDKIYETLLRSNRSLPWIEASLRATSILINLAKYSPTKSFVLKENYIEVIMRYLTVTVEKNVNLFLHLATLLWILVEDRDYAKAVLTNKRAIWLLRKLEATVRGKRKNFLYSKEAKFLLPNSKPDWGLEQREPRLFKDVHHATISIKNKLGKY
ncbi:uncharacterized protein LOC122504909 isoform X2 [Leptopilina heterotoma]|uniref:uncharacterized protein LOC122504909 isoform X2 n=1 Tax=Leptopilina heterotoma TaxID=63436 RepID=UPI001CA8A1F9|nr:uncharacterized protein LOC122504909 isoform X2 [Leptopilina heterotoma]